MSYRISCNAGAARGDLGSPIESFLLFYNFNLAAVPFTGLSYYSAFLSVEDTTPPIAPSIAKAPAVIPIPAGPGTITIAESSGNQNRIIAWQSNQWKVTQCQCFHSRTTLYVTGSLGAILPHPAGTNFGVPQYNHGIAAPQGQLAGGNPHHPVNVSINGVPCPVYGFIHSGDGNRTTHLGYVGQFRTGSGFDAILHSQQTMAFPSFGFPTANKLTVTNIGQYVGAAPVGFALVAAGSFKRCIPAISKSLYDRFCGINGLDPFYNLMDEFISGMDSDTITNVESIDNSGFVPHDLPSDDFPVEIIMFQFGGGLGAMSDPV